MFGKASTASFSLISTTIVLKNFTASAEADQESTPPERLTAQPEKNSIMCQHWKIVVASIAVRKLERPVSCRRESTLVLVICTGTGMSHSKSKGQLFQPNSTHPVTVREENASTVHCDQRYNQRGGGALKRLATFPPPDTKCPHLADGSAAWLAKTKRELFLCFMWGE